MLRRTVGIDLAISAVQVAQIFDDGVPMGKPIRFRLNAEDLGNFVAAVTRDVPQGVPIQAIMEPTGMAWFPVASWLQHAGVHVIRVEGTASQGAASVPKRACQDRSGRRPCIGSPTELRWARARPGTRAGPRPARAAAADQATSSLSGTDLLIAAAPPGPDPLGPSCTGADPARYDDAPDTVDSGRVLRPASCAQDPARDLDSFHRPDPTLTVPGHIFRRSACNPLIS
jgi:hypothetical protein